MCRPIYRLYKSTCGTAAVEMALIMPLFLLMMLGVFEIGRIYWIQNTLNNSVMHAGRFAEMNASASNLQIQAEAQANLGALPVGDVSYNFSASSSGGINFTTITASYTYTPLVAGLLPFAVHNFTRQVTVPRGI